MRKIAEQFGVDPGTVQRISAALSEVRTRLREARRTWPGRATCARSCHSEQARRCVQLPAAIEHF